MVNLMNTRWQQYGLLYLDYVSVQLVSRKLVIELTSQC